MFFTQQYKSNVTVQELRDHNYQLQAEDIQELYYIAPIANLENILIHGILSHNKAEALKLKSTDFSNSGVQGNRQGKKVPRLKQNKRPLTIHQHANFYIQPHNAMMKVIVNAQDPNSLCVLRISKKAFDRGDAILSKRNAAKDKCQFFGIKKNLATETLEFIDLEAKKEISSVFDPSETEWIAGKYSNGGYTYDFVDNYLTDRKPMRQSEVLFPHKLSSKFIKGVFVYNARAQESVQAVLTRQEANFPIDIHPSLFLPKKNFQQNVLLLFKPLNDDTFDYSNSSAFNSPTSSDDESPSYPF